jgi:uncharacterized OB-fold protein
MSGQLEWVPAIPQIRIGQAGKPMLLAVRCNDCGQIHFERPLACPRCLSRAPMDELPLLGLGTLYSYTIVHRSFPGVKTPFVMAIVDMAEGTTLRGNLHGIEPDPEAIPSGLPVRLVFQESGQRDENGQPYLIYAFEPETAP